jgi:glycosidase
MTRSLPETYDIVARWRQIVDEYTLKTPEQSRVLITDADVGTSDSLRYYKSGAHLPINFALTDLISATMNGTELSELLHSWLDGLPADDPNATATWLTGDQDRSRLGSYIDARYVNVINMLKLTLPGTAFVYYGEEIGMTNSNFTTNQQDPAGDIDLKFSRDPYRTPMQWTNNNDHAGFINESVYRPTSPPWLPVNLYPYNNVSVSVESQQNETDGGSVGLIKNLTILRNTEGSLRFGKIHFTYTTGNIFSFVREHQGFDRILVLLNVGQSPEESFDLTKQKYTISIPSEATIILTTNSSMSLAEGDQINLRKLYVDPGNGFIARWPYTRPLN